MRRFRSALRADYDPVVLQGEIKTADEITDEWLGSVLGADDLELDGVEAIGTGQMSKVYRVSYARPGGERESVAVKLAATENIALVLVSCDPGARSDSQVFSTPRLRRVRLACTHEESVA